MKLALRGAAWFVVFNLAAVSRLADAVRLEIEHRLTGAEPRPASDPYSGEPSYKGSTTHGGVGFGGDSKARHDGGASGRFGA